MSDITDLFEGRMGKDPVVAVETFAKKEWNNLNSFIAKLPADLKPVAQEAMDDTKVVLVDAAEWSGTAFSAYVAANGDKLAGEVVNLLQGAMAGSSVTSLAGQTAVQAMTKLVQALVAHALTDFVNAATPTPLPSAPPPVLGTITAVPQTA